MSKEELLWLERLTNGATVAQIATEAGCSERYIYRRLNALYVRLGVRNRGQAISRARVANSPISSSPGTSTTADGNPPGWDRDPRTKGRS